MICDNSLVVITESKLIGFFFKRSQKRAKTKTSLLESKEKAISHLATDILRTSTLHHRVPCSKNPIKIPCENIVGKGEMLHGNQHFSLFLTSFSTFLSVLIWNLSSAEVFNFQQS